MKSTDDYAGEKNNYGIENREDGVIAVCAICDGDILDDFPLRFKFTPFPGTKSNHLEVYICPGCFMHLSASFKFLYEYEQY